MNLFPFSLVYALLLDGPACVSDERLTVVTDIPAQFIHRLYHVERRIEPHSPLNRTAEQPHTRARICDDISSTGIFQRYHCEPVNLDEMYHELQQAKYSDIFDLIYQATLSEYSLYPQHDYVNPYRKVLIEFVYEGYRDPDLASQTVAEHMFVCLLRQQADSNDIIPYYVSEAYYDPPYQGHRFLFLQDHPHHLNSLLMLVETSAEVYERPDFNVELHYLQLREVHQPAENRNADPVCQLSNKQFEENQSFRLCAIVLGSSFFKDTINYSNEIITNKCHWRKISFRTTEAVEKSRGKLYYELLLRCYAEKVDTGESALLYISRAYNPHQVFVHVSDDLDIEINLHVLSTNVNIVHESFNFGDVEI